MNDIDWGARWTQARENYMTETPPKCGKCTVQFRTGDVLFIFGNLDIAAELKHFYCNACGYGYIAHVGMFPSATLIFIEEGHREVELSWLSPEQIEWVKEAFAIVDRIHSEVAAYFAALGKEQLS